METLDIVAKLDRDLRILEERFVQVQQQQQALTAELLRIQGEVRYINQWKTAIPTASPEQDEQMERGEPVIVVDQGLKDLVQ